MSVLRKKTTSIPLVGGLERRNGGEDLTALTQLPLLPRAINVFRSRSGEWKQRPGHVAISTGDAVGGGFTMAGFVGGVSVSGQMRVFTKNGQWRKSDTDSVFSLAESSSPRPSFGGRVSLRTNSLPEREAQTGCQVVALAIGGGVAVTVALTGDESTPAGAGTARITASRAPDGAIIQEITPGSVGISLFGFSTLASRFQVLYSAVYDKFVVLFTRPNGASATTLSAVVGTPAQFLAGTVNATFVTVATDLVAESTSTNIFFDAMVEEDVGDIVVAYRGTGGTTRALRFRASNNSIPTAAVSVSASGDVAANSLAWARCPSFPQAQYRLFTAINSAVGVVERTITKSTLAQASSLTVQASPGNVGSVTGWVTTGGNRRCHFDVVDTTNPQRSSVWTAKESGGTWGTPTEANAGALRLHGHPFLAYPDGATQEQWATPVCGSITSAGKLFMASFDEKSSSLEASHAMYPLVELLDGQADTTPAVNGMLGSVASYNGSFYYGVVKWLSRSADVTLAATNRFAYVKQGAIAVFGFGQRVNPVMIDADTALIPGSSWTKSDGSTGDGAPWPCYQAPPLYNVTQGAGGSLDQLATYQFVNCCVTVDSKGRRWVGAPSAATKITLTGTNANVSYSYSKGPLYYSGHVYIEQYRTIGNGTKWYRYRAYRNDYSPVSSSISGEGLSDDTVETGLQLYTDGGELFHLAPPPSNAAWIGGARLLCVDSTAPHRVWASSEFTPGEGPWFHPDMTISIPAGSEIVAGAFMDGRNFVFTKKEIYAFSGDWPNRKGQGLLPEVQRLAVGVGGSSQESTVVTKEGIWFYSEDRGLCLLDRSLTVITIGKAVDGVITAAPVAILLSEKYDHVRVYQANGVVAVYDQIEQQWSHWQIGGLGGASVTGAFIHNRDVIVLTSGSLLLKEDASAKTDNGTAFDVGVDLRVPMGPPGGKGRVYRAALSGLLYGDTTLTCTVFNDFGNVGSGEEAKIITIKGRPGETTPAMYEVNVLPRSQRCESMLFRFSFQSTEPGITYRALAMEIGVYQPVNLKRLPSGSRF